MNNGIGYSLYRVHAMAGSLLQHTKNEFNDVAVGRMGAIHLRRLLVLTGYAYMDGCSGVQPAALEEVLFHQGVSLSRPHIQHPALRRSAKYIEDTFSASVIKLFSGILHSQWRL